MSTYLNPLKLELEPFVLLPVFFWGGGIDDMDPM